MKRPIIIYHANCLDGFAAAYAVYTHFVDEKHCQCDFVEGIHGHMPPDATGRDVIIVDFSYRRSALEELCKTACSVTNLDHHLTAEQDLAGLDREFTNLRVVFNMEKSGAVLAWEYFHTTPVPRIFLHIQARDLWRFTLEKTNDIYAALMARPFDFADWTELLASSEGEELLAREGEAINRYRRKMIDLLRVKAAPATIAGHRIPVVNCYEEIASDLLGELAVGQPFAAGYQDQGNLRKWSLRSSPEGVNVAAIAQLFGGGGHTHAAGFTTQLPETHLILDVSQGRQQP